MGPQVPDPPHRPLLLHCVQYRLSDGVHLSSRSYRCTINILLWKTNPCSSLHWKARWGNTFPTFYLPLHFLRALILPLLVLFQCVIGCIIFDVFHSFLREHQKRMYIVEWFYVGVKSDCRWTTGTWCGGLEASGKRQVILSSHWYNGSMWEYPLLFSNVLRHYIEQHGPLGTLGLVCMF